MTEARRKQNKRRYMKRESEHRCVACGKIDERTLRGCARCDECNKKYHPNKEHNRDPIKYAQEQEGKREIARLRKSAHVCVGCGEQDERTIKGRTYCKKCARKRNEGQKKRRETGKINEMERQRRAKWKEQGLCTNCGRKKEEHEFAMCIDCRVKIRMRRRREKFQSVQSGKPTRGTPGICFQCAKNKAMDGKKLCAECYQKKLMLPQIWRGDR